MLQRNEHVAVFVSSAGKERHAEERLVIPEWQRADWETFLSYTTPLSISAGSVLIQKDEAARTLFLVASGLLEVTAILSSDSLASITKIKPGSAVGELAFLDGKPRSAKVSAVEDSDLYRFEYEDYRRFARDHPAQAGQLVFGIAGLVALRLRRTFATS